MSCQSVNVNVLSCQPRSGLPAVVGSLNDNWPGERATGPRLKHGSPPGAAEAKILENLLSSVFFWLVQLSFPVVLLCSLHLQPHLTCHGLLN